MATTYNRRCSLCGQFVASQDREQLLAEDRFQWDEALVDDFIAGSGHLCVDTDPHGARESARLIDAGLIAPQLDWLIAAELERRRLASRPPWAVFTGFITLATMVAGARPLAPRRPFSGSARVVRASVCVLVPPWPYRSSPAPGRAYRPEPPGPAP